MNTTKKLKKELKKKSPKAWAKAEKRWDVKMIPDVTDFIIGIGKHMRNDSSFTYDGPAIEEMVWKLLIKARRLQ